MRLRARSTKSLSRNCRLGVPLCARAGVLRPRVVATDGTKLTVRHPRGASRIAAELPEQILSEAEAIDRAKDAGDRGSDLKDRGADEAMGSSAWSRPRSAPWPAR